MYLHLIIVQNHPLRLCNAVFIFGDDAEDEELGEPSSTGALQDGGYANDAEQAPTQENNESEAGDNAMKHMVDEIVGPEDENLWTPAQRIPQMGTSALKPTPTTASNDTTDYGVIGTLTAQELAQQIRASKSPQSPTFQGKLRQPVSPRPHLPSISPSPFTPTPGELDNVSPIVPRRPSINMATPKQVFSLSTSSEAISHGTPFSPVKYASSPIQPRGTQREGLKRARTSVTMGPELQSWGTGENWPLNGQG